MLSKEKHFSNINAFVCLMNFSCVIYHLFYNVVEVFSHPNHCRGHNIYAYGSILGCLVQSPYCLTFLANYPSNATTIDKTLCRNLAKFWNVNCQPLFFVKPPMISSCHLQKVSIEILVSARTEMILWWKGWWIVSLYLPSYMGITG